MSLERLSYFTLTNGLRCVHLHSHGKSGHCGLLINAGSRDEKPGEEGLAHFIEHLLFKGTTTRTARHIVSQIDEVGGELNAYTTKENTFIYASFPGNYLERSLKLIADIAFNSTFPVKEMEKERAVVLDEFLSYKDDPSEEISDEWDSLMFPDHPLGTNILGTQETIESFQQHQLFDFLKQHYTTNRMTLAYAGPDSAESFKHKSEKFFGQVPSSHSNALRIVPAPYSPFKKRVIKDNHTCHVILGNRACSIHHPHRVPFVLLNNILGGPGLNSRLNLQIREKYGYTYYLESSYAGFEDSGVWYIYLSTEKKRLEKTLQLVHRELKTLREKPLTSGQLAKAKIQLKGQITMSNDNGAAMLGIISRHTLLFGRVETLEETFRRIDNITHTEIQELAQIYFSPEQISELIYLPK